MSTLRKGVSTATTLLFILTQFLLCTAFPKYGWNQKSGDSFSTGRSLLFHDEYVHDRAVFFIVLSIGTVVIGVMARCMCRKGYCTGESSSTTNSRPVVHPPPPQVPTIQVAYTNSGFVPAPLVPPPSAPLPYELEDHPPAYTAVVQGDLSQQNLYPMVTSRPVQH